MFRIFGAGPRRIRIIYCIIYVRDAGAGGGVPWKCERRPHAVDRFAGDMRWASRNHINLAGTSRAVLTHTRTHIFFVFLCSGGLFRLLLFLYSPARLLLQLLTLVPRYIIEHGRVSLYKWRIVVRTVPRTTPRMAVTVLRQLSMVVGGARWWGGRRNHFFAPSKPTQTHHNMNYYDIIYIYRYLHFIMDDCGEKTFGHINCTYRSEIYRYTQKRQLPRRNVGRSRVLTTYAQINGTSIFF